MVFMLVRYGFKAGDGDSAILRWRPQVQSLLAGHDVYHGDAQAGVIADFPNAPLVGVAQAPLLWLRPWPAAMLFYLLKLCLAALAFSWAVRIAGGGRPVPGAAVLVTLALILWPILGDLGHGNINIFVMFFCTAGLWAFVNGRDRTCGVLLGLAAAVKVTPALFLIYFAYKRRWRVVSWFIGSGLCFTFIVPALVLGPVHNARMVWAWMQTLILPYVSGQTLPEITTQINQSFTGMVYRLLTESPGVEHREQKYYVNFLSLSPGVARWILKALAAALLTALALLCRTPTHNRRDWRLPCEFGLVIVAMLMLSERSWKHHYVIMVVPYAALAACLFRRELGETFRRYLALTALGAFLLMYVVSSDLAELFVPDLGDKYVDAYGSYVWGAMAVFGALGAVLWCQRLRPADAADRDAPLDTAAAGTARGHADLNVS